MYLFVEAKLVAKWTNICFWPKKMSICYNLGCVGETCGVELAFSRAHA